MGIAKLKNIWKHIWSAFWIILFIFLLISFFVFQKVDINGKSMEPNYVEGELLIVNRWSDDLERGQVVTFYSDSDQLEETSTWEKIFPFMSMHPNKIFLKRVVGMPGEEIEVVGSHVVIYNDQYPDGALLVEEYLDEEVAKKADTPILNDNYYSPRMVIEDGHYFLMGDNRPVSTDSRDDRYGAFPKDNLFGKEVFRYWPFDKAEKFELPEYDFIELTEERRQELDDLKKSYLLMKDSSTDE